MRLFLSLVLAVKACGLMGCGDARPSSLADSHKAKLEAALSIQDDLKRNEALVVVADAAAAAGQPEVVTIAVREIRDDNVSNRAAASAALKLSELGKIHEATEIAKLIRDDNKRNATLAQIAKGNGGK